MPKRELNIPIDKFMYSDTKEDIIFRSPRTIPHQDLQNILALRSVQGNDYAYFDIAPTEKQTLRYNVPPLLDTAYDLDPNNFNDVWFLSSTDLSVKMGSSNSI